MDIYILRHGIAEDRSATGADRDRELTAEGRKKTREAGQALRALEIKFDRVLSSPFARAWQTAEIIVEELECEQRLEACPALSSGAPLKGVLAELKTLSCPSALLVGHEPDLSRLISVLISGTPDVALVMKKGGLAKVHCLSAEPGHARLEWLLGPKHLCRLGN